MADLRRLFDSLAGGKGHAALVAFEGDGATSLSFSALDAQSGAFAAAIRTRAAAGAPVVLLAAPTGAAVAAALGALRAGVLLTLIDTQFGDEALRQVLDDARPLLALCDRRQCERLRHLRAGLPQLSLEMPPVVTGEPPAPHLAADADAVLFYTSGTTGPPKGVPLSQANLAYQMEAVAATGLVRSGDRVLLPLPLHHVYPFVVGLLTPLALGLPVVLPGSLTGPALSRALHDAGPTVVIGVPRLYRGLYDALLARTARGGRLAETGFRRLLDASARIAHRTGRSPLAPLFAPVRRRVAPRLRLLACGGAALDPQLGYRLAGLGWRVAVGYGLTETSPLLTLNLPGGPLDSVGRPVPGTELAVRDGELVARGPGVFKGYRNRPDADPFTDDGWFRTGDLGHISDGWVHVTGRTATVIVTESGENVQPEALEEAYEADPAVREAAIIGRDGRLAALLVAEAAAVREAGGDADAVVRAALERVGRRLPSHRRVSEYAITRDPLPRTRLGKLRRHQLAERYEAARSGREAVQAGPLPVEAMSDADRALLEVPAAHAAWELLAARHPQHRLTPDSSPQLDLGIDSIGWLDLGLALQERAGVSLDDERIATIGSVRDLLQAAAGAAAVGETASPVLDPEQVLGRRERRWLRPLGPTRRSLAHAVHRLDRALVTRTLDLQVEGPRDLPEPCVLAPNHASYLDPFVLAACLDWQQMRHTFWAAWTGAAFRNRLVRGLSRLAMAIPIDAERGFRTSLALAAAVLKGGYSLVWFPEGQRSLDGRLRPFRPGLGRLLAEYRVPTVPVYIDGTYQAWPPGQWLPHRGPVRVVFGEPLWPDELEQRGHGDSPGDRMMHALHERMEVLARQAASGGGRSAAA